MSANEGSKPLGPIEDLSLRALSGESNNCIIGCCALTIGTLRYPGRGGKENGESLERGRRHLRGKNKLRLSRLGGVLA